jgi:hypothetical protein
VNRDEALRVGRQERRYVVAVPDEQAHELASLVGGDPAGYAEENPSHVALVPV